VIEPPRANGELVFERPWESRVFGVAMALREAGVLDAEQFRGALIERLMDGGAYYEAWQDALEQVLIGTGVLSKAELARAEREAARRASHRH
jgi:hypothetical protein